MSEGQYRDESETEKEEKWRGALGISNKAVDRSKTMPLVRPLLVAIV